MGIFRATNCSLTCFLATSGDTKLTTQNLARFKYFSLKLADRIHVRSHANGANTRNASHFVISCECDERFHLGEDIVTVCKAFVELVVSQGYSDMDVDVESLAQCGRMCMRVTQHTFPCCLQKCNHPQLH